MIERTTQLDSNGNRVVKTHRQIRMENAKYTQQFSKPFNLTDLLLYIRSDEI